MMKKEQQEMEHVPSIFQTVSDLAKLLHPVEPDDAVCLQYAWWMLESLFEKDRTALVQDKNLTMSDEQRARLDQWIHEQVHQHKPLAYILGYVPFLDLTIHVAPPILIPRPETEEWVELVFKDLSLFAAHRLKVLDLCTGSGCIALALGKHFPMFEIYGLDISYEALDLARRNAMHNGVTNVQFMHSDLFSKSSSMNVDVIVANPPYIAENEWHSLMPSVREWEDKRALIAPDEGFGIIEKIIRQAPAYLRATSVLHAAGARRLWVEIDCRQKDKVVTLLETCGYSNIDVVCDSSKRPRVARASIGNNEAGISPVKNCNVSRAKRFTNSLYATRCKCGNCRS